MKHTIRAFAIGLFTATSLLAFMFYQDDPNTNAGQTLSEEKAREFLEEKNYHIMSNQEWHNLQEKLNEPNELAEEDATTKPEEEASENKPKEDAQVENPKVINAFTISIQEGMYPKEIGEQLKEAGILSEEDDFRQYLIEHDYSRYIQIGNHTVNDQMTLEELAKTITGQ